MGSRGHNPDTVAGGDGMTQKDRRRPILAWLAVATVVGMLKDVRSCREVILELAYEYVDSVERLQGNAAGVAAKGLDVPSPCGSGRSRA
jgi:hypothetical protein